MRAALTSLIVVILFFCSAASSQEPSGDKPTVIILATGGTIAGSSASNTDTEYQAGVLDVSSLISAVPNLELVANVIGEQIANVGSQDMNGEIWSKLANRISQLQNDPAISGIVITHGTDTIEETAFFLDLLFPYGKPIVLTGSMRPSDAISADGPQNLEDAVTLATNASAKDRVMSQKHIQRILRHLHQDSKESSVNFRTGSQRFLPLQENQYPRSTQLR